MRRLSIPLFAAVLSLFAAPYVAPDIAARAAKWQPTRMPFDASGLTPKERQVVEKLVEASRQIEAIYWEQSDPDGLALFHSLSSKPLSPKPADANLRRLLWIHGGRYDLVDEQKPFAGSDPFAPGRALYPKDLTRSEVESYVQAHPEMKEKIFSAHTLIRRKGPDLEAVPYETAFKARLTAAAESLNEAARLTPDPGFANFLRLRAVALTTGEYYESDLAWVRLKDPKIDLILAPYETYLDGLLGVKGSYGAAVLIRNEPESKKLAVFQQYVPDIQDSLPLAPEDRPSKRGQPSPMEVMDAPFRAGDLRHGYQAVADNLPNDPRIHEKAGTKKIFFKNFMDARVNRIVLPVAKQLMRADQASKASGEGYLAAVMMHEICHGLGPAYARKNGQRSGIREAIGPLFSGLEEAKADVTGMYGLHWLVIHDALPKSRLAEYYASYVAGIFRTVRFGVEEAHGRAEMMEFNYLVEHKAIQRDGSGLYGIDFGLIAAAIDSLAKELLEIEATGDRSRCEQWFSRYDKMPPDLRASLAALKGVPIDVDPIFSFSEEIR